MPAAPGALEAVALMDPGTTLRARSAIAVAAKPAGPGARPLFGDDVTAPPYDPDAAPIAAALSDAVVHRVLDARPDLRAQADKDAAASNGESAKVLGFPGSAATQATLAMAVELLALDAPATVDLALAGLLAGRPERVAILSDALGILASFPASSGGTPAVTVGRAKDSSGATTLTNVRTAPTGFVTGFTMLGHSYALQREGTAPVSAKRDGAPVTLAMLEGARAPVSSGELWSAAGVVFAKMAGSPRAGVAPGGRVRLVAAGRGVDAIATAGPGDDAQVEADVEVTGEGAIVLRAVATPSGFQGVALVLDASASPPKAAIRAWDDAGKLTELVPPAAIVPSSSYPVRITVKGSKLEAHVGATVLRASVPDGLAHGDIALAVRRGGAVEARGWSVKPAR
jgi:hypothetical protein